jgi:hypothetical protein
MRGRSADDGEGRLLLECGSVLTGRALGFPATIAGEVVFNMGMVGYPEALTDPSYKGQILTLTYPPGHGHPAGLDGPFESGAIQIAGLVVSEAVPGHRHWSATRSLGQWLQRTRGYRPSPGSTPEPSTQRLGERGPMLGKRSSPAGTTLVLPAPAHLHRDHAPDQEDHAEDRRGP